MYALMYSQKIIAVSSLFLNPKNPRIEPVTGQREVYAELTKNKRDKEKLLKLCFDIVEMGGLNGGSNVLVLYEENKPIVYDGNRRILALKILNNPTEASWGEFFSKRELNRLKKKLEGAEVPNRISVNIYEDQMFLEKTVSNIHTATKGEGLEPWTTIQKKRQERKMGEKVPILDLFEHLGRYPEYFNSETLTYWKEKQFTLFERLFRNTAVQKNFGLKKVKSKEGLVWGNNEISKRNLRIINSLLVDAKDKNLDSRFFKKNEDIDNFIDNLVSNYKSSDDDAEMVDFVVGKGRITESNDSDAKANIEADKNILQTNDNLEHSKNDIPSDDGYNSVQPRFSRTEATRSTSLRALDSDQRDLVGDTNQARSVPTTRYNSNTLLSPNEKFPLSNADIYKGLKKLYDEMRLIRYSEFPYASIGLMRMYIESAVKYTRALIDAERTIRGMQKEDVVVQNQSIRLEGLNDSKDIVSKFRHIAEHKDLRISGQKREKRKKETNIQDAIQLIDQCNFFIHDSTQTAFVERLRAGLIENWPVFCTMLKEADAIERRIGKYIRVS